MLDSPNGSMKRDAWTEGFDDVIFALDFPESQVDSPSQPELLPGGVVHIPDTNLRAAIAEELGKSPNAPITVEDIGKLEGLDAVNRDIRDLTGLQFATNLEWLEVGENQFSDLSPLAGLINLRTLSFPRSNVSDLSPLAGLINLDNLWFNAGAKVSDLSPLAGLINLRIIHAGGHSISDLSPLSGLTKLEHIYFPGTGLISDLSPLAGLTRLKELYLHRSNISNISLLARFTALERLGLASNEISDLSPLAGLPNLKWLHLENNEISDVSFLAGLSQLKWLNISNNQISNLSPLDRLRENITTLLWHGNPAFPKGGPKIEGPWLWVLVPDREIDSSTDLLSEASGGTVTEMGVSIHGATEGKAVSDDVWTAHRLPPTGHDNIGRMLKESIRDGVLYGTVSFYSPQQQETTIYVGSEDESKVWLNGVLIYENFRRRDGDNYTDFFPVTLKQGKNVLLVAVEIIGENGDVFLGFEPGTDYTVSTGLGYAFSKTPIHVGDTFTFDVRAENITDLAGWQFDIDFDPTILEAVDVSEGEFLKTDGGSTFFQPGSIDNTAGKITGLSAARLSAQGATGSGTLLQVRFKAKSVGETALTLHKFQFGSATGDSIPAGPHQITIVVEGRLTTGDVNRDGVVSILDLILVAQQLGRRVSAGSSVDVNGDGIVSILDLIRVAQGIAESPAAPPLIPPQAGGEGRVDAATIKAWIAQARLEDDGSLVFKEGIKNLEKLLASLIPEETALLANYPNPFNPETWIPYQLAESAEVTLTIYDMNGHLIRRLVLGHQAAGMYRSRSRAVYWDGRNQLGEPVASGLYFYTLTAGEFTETRRMLILK